MDNDPRMQPPAGGGDTPRSPEDSRLLGEVEGMLKHSPRWQKGEQPTMSEPPKKSTSEDSGSRAATGETIPRAQVNPNPEPERPAPEPTPDSRSRGWLATLPFAAQSTPATEPAAAAPPPRQPSTPTTVLADARSRLPAWMNPSANRSSQRQNALGNLLRIIVLLSLLLLIAAVTGQVNRISFLGWRAPSVELLSEQLNPNGTAAGVAGQTSNVNQGDVAPPGQVTVRPEIAPRFREHYNQRGGLAIFGHPVSPELVVNGRTIQWFERTRLEEWPEHAGTSYAVQGGRIGREYTTGYTFPTEPFFVSTPTARYFVETGYSVRNGFLRFWETNGAIETFGYPISGEVQERMPNGRVITVQYFERARFEFYPDLAGTPNEVQLGLLGRAVYFREARPDIITPVGVMPPTP